MSINTPGNETARLFIELATATGEYPQITAIRADDPIFGIEGFARRHRLPDLFLQPTEVVTVDMRFSDVLWQVVQRLFGG
jgi:hypothetical protein